MKDADRPSVDKTDTNIFLNVNSQIVYNGDQIQLDLQRTGMTAISIDNLALEVRPMTENEVSEVWTEDDTSRKIRSVSLSNREPPVDITDMTDKHGIPARGSITMTPNVDVVSNEEVEDGEEATAVLAVELLVDGRIVSDGYIEIILD